jgi:hypothetical protein
MTARLDADAAPTTRALTDAASLPTAPAPADRLLALLAGTRARREAASAEVAPLLRELDLERFFDRLARHRLLPLLGARLLALAGGGLDPELASRAEASLRDARRASLGMEMMTLPLTRALRAEGVPVAVLKGPFLARELHDDPGARVSNDIDLLVAAGDFHRAGEVLGSLGYVAAGRTVWHDGLPLFESSLRHAGGQPAIDLHWRLHWYERAFSEQALALAEEDPADGFRRLRPRDTLVSLLLGYARDGFWGLRPLVDIAACWDMYGGTLEPACLQPVMDADPELAPCLRAAAHVVSGLAGLPLERLLPASPGGLSRAEALACELASWDERMTPRQYRASTALADILVAPPGGRGAAVARYYAPPLEVGSSSAARPVLARTLRAAARARYAAGVAVTYLPATLGLLAQACRARLAHSARRIAVVRPAPAPHAARRSTPA